MRASPAPHRLDPRQRFGCADEHGASDTRRLCHHVETIVIPIYKVNVGVPGPAEHARVARGRSAIPVTRRIQKRQIRFGFDDAQACLVAGGALLLYLQETLKASLAHLHRLRPYRQNKFLFLDEVTRRSLELTRTLREGARGGSLLAVLDRTVTLMGTRLLQEWILNPLADRAAIEELRDAMRRPPWLT